MCSCFSFTKIRFLPLFSKGFSLFLFSSIFLFFSKACHMCCGAGNVPLCVCHLGLFFFLKKRQNEDHFHQGLENKATHGSGQTSSLPALKTNLLKHEKLTQRTPATPCVGQVNSDQGQVRKCGFDCRVPQSASRRAQEIRILWCGWPFARRAQETLGNIWGAQGSQESPEEPREVHFGPRGAQKSPEEPRTAWESPGQPRRAQEIRILWCGWPFS